MEGIIVKIGKQCHKFVQQPEGQSRGVRIGRGFTNDIIISDPFVAPEHVTITINDGNWQLDILDVTNPVFHNRKVAEETSLALKSGDEVTIGKTNFRIYSEGHAVEETREFAFANWLNTSPYKAVIAFAMLLLSFLLALCTTWLHTYVEIEWGKLIAQSIFLPIMVVVWSATWSLTGKFLRHHHYFFSHLFLTSIVACLLVIFADFYSYIDYIFSSLLTGELIDWVLLTGLVGLLIGFNLSLSTNIRHTFLTGLSVSACILGIAFLIGYLSMEDFSNSPDHTQTAKPPSLPTFNVVSADEHISSYSEIFEQLKEEEAKE